MNVTREVILDLLPVYLAGEASPATRALVEEYLRQDPELAQRIRLQYAENLAAAVPSALPPDIELRALRRTHKLLAWQRWLFGLGIAFAAVAFSFEFSFEGSHFKEFHFLLRDFPTQMGMCVLLSLACWIAYVLIRRRLRAGML